MFARMSSIWASGLPPAAWKRRTTATAGATASWRAYPVTTAPKASTGGGRPATRWVSGRVCGLRWVRAAYGSCCWHVMPARPQVARLRRHNRHRHRQQPQAQAQARTLSAGHVADCGEHRLCCLHVSVACQGIHHGVVGPHIHCRGAVAQQGLKGRPRLAHLPQPAVRLQQRHRCRDESQARQGRPDAWGSTTGLTAGKPGCQPLQHPKDPTNPAPFHPPTWTRVV